MDTTSHYSIPFMTSKCSLLKSLAGITSLFLLLSLLSVSMSLYTWIDIRYAIVYWIWILVLVMSIVGLSVYLLVHTMESQQEDLDSSAHWDLEAAKTYDGMVMDSSSSTFSSEESP